MFRVHRNNNMSPHFHSEQPDNIDQPYWCSRALSLYLFISWFTGHLCVCRNRIYLLWQMSNVARDGTYLFPGTLNQPTLSCINPRPNGRIEFRAQLVAAGCHPVNNWWLCVGMKWHWIYVEIWLSRSTKVRVGFRAQRTYCWMTKYIPWYNTNISQKLK